MANKNEKVSDNILGIDKIFDNFLKPGKIREEKTIFEGFTIAIEPLTLNDLTLVSYVSYREGMPQDVIVKVRAARILSKAIISINGCKVADGEDKEEDNAARDHLYSKIMEMPAVVVEKMYQFYLEVEDKRDSIFKNPEDVSKAIENF